MNVGPLLGYNFEVLVHKDGVHFVTAFKLYQAFPVVTIQQLLSHRSRYYSSEVAGERGRKEGSREPQKRTPVD